MQQQPKAGGFLRSAASPDHKLRKPVILPPPLCICISKHKSAGQSQALATLSPAGEFCFATLRNGLFFRKEKQTGILPSFFAQPGSACCPLRLQQAPPVSCSAVRLSAPPPSPRRLRFLRHSNRAPNYGSQRPSMRSSLSLSSPPPLAGDSPGAAARERAGARVRGSARYSAERKPLCCFSAFGDQNGEQSAAFFLFPWLLRAGACLAGDYTGARTLAALPGNIVSRLPLPCLGSSCFEWLFATSPSSLSLSCGEGGERSALARRSLLLLPP